MLGLHLDRNEAWNEVVWVREEELAMALLGRNHRLFTTFHEKKHNSIQWLFYKDNDIMADIYNHDNVQLMVNSHWHYNVVQGFVTPKDDRG